METVDLIAKASSFGMVQRPEEISGLIELLKKHQPKNILEIGSESGGTFYLWCQLAKIGGINISLDLPSGDSGSGTYRDPVALAKRTAQFKCWSANVHVVTGDSHEQRTRQAVDDLLNRGREKLDFLFIDGDHSYQGVKADFEDYRGFVRPGGLIAFHDIVDSEFHRRRGCHVSKFWEELARKPVTFPALEFNQGLEWGGIGVITV